MEDKAQMEQNLTKVMILFQKKYNSIREINKLTKELSEALERNDEVSVNMLLQMRADEMEKADNCMEQIWLMGESNKQFQKKLRLLISSEPKESRGESLEEKKIYEIREKTQSTLEEIRALDQKINRSVTREKSYYGTGTLRKDSRLTKI